jgi:CubicO group peptidase (beta-lactamase class C family)
MRRMPAVALASFLLTVACLPDSAVVFDDRFSEARELIRDQVSDGGVPSIAVAVAQDGEIVWEEAFGWSDVENQVRATPHTPYRLGSITKTITATGLMLLVEQGTVDLDRPAVDYLPRDVRPRAFEGDVDEVTVRHLLNHRAGIPAYAESFFEDDEEAIRPLAETVRRYGIIAFPPGWSFIYCNLGYEMVASMIAEVSGMSYAEFIEERVLSPLGMTRSGVGQGSPLEEPYAACYTPALERIPSYRTGYPGGDGNYASAHDLIRFAMFHMGDRLPDQKAILTDTSLAAMQEAYPPSNQRYGLGWDLDASERGYRSVCHGGEGPGVDAFMRLFPTEDIAAVVLCNAECRLYEIQKAIFTALIPELGEPEPVEPDAVETSVTPEPADEPSELNGAWLGKIIAYDRELDVELLIDGTGATVAVGGQPDDELEITVLTPTFLLGMFDAEIPTPDNQRYPYRNRLAVATDGDRLFGAITSVGWREGRAGHYELSSRIELRRSPPGMATRQ